MSALPILDFSVSTKLAEFYRACREHFGYAENWWPGNPLEITVTAILVQQCDWTKARAAQLRLTDCGLLGLSQLARADEKEVRDCLQGVSFHRTKAERLIKIGRRLTEDGVRRIEDLLEGRPTADIRQQLLSLEGVGDETADCILAFAGNHPRLVVDASLRRVFRRIHPAPQLESDFWDQSYDMVQEFLQRHLLADMSLYEDFSFDGDVPLETALMRDFHAQILELARHHCLKNNPRCREQGKGGWSNYPWCDNHCREGVCRQCPVWESCTVGGRNRV